MNRQKYVKTLMPFIALILIYAVFKVIQPERFGTLDSMYILLQQTLIHCILACGIYFLLTVGIFDLTVGANTMISAMVGVLLSEQIGVLGLVLGAFVTSMVIAYISGHLMIRLEAPPMIISVGLVIIYEALSTELCNGSYSLAVNEAYRGLGLAPYNLFPGIIMLLLAAFILKFTKFGLYINAIGANPRIAANAGINVKKYKTYAFLFCGLCAFVYGLMSLFYASAVAASSSTMSSATSIFKPLIACMFATSFKKYLNPMIALFTGCFFLNLISNGLLTNGLEAALQNVVVGLAMIAIVRMSSTDRKYDVVK